MKSLSESLFDDDLSTRDPLDSLMKGSSGDEHDIDIDAINKAMDQLIEIYADGIYNLKGATDKDLADLSKKYTGKDYILFRQLSSKNMKRFKYKYDIGWPDEKRDNLYDVYYVSNFYKKWEQDIVIDYDWSLRSFNGLVDLLRRSKNLGYESVAVITNKKFIDTLKKYLVDKSK